MNNYFKKIEKFMFNNYINNYPDELKDKFKYLVENGKRLRPILCLIFSNSNTSISNEINYNEINNCTIKTNTDIIYTVALCIELIHALSLVLDDLPEMDNDLIRRDNPAFHIKYGTEYTNFFLYYMFNMIGLLLDNCMPTYINNDMYLTLLIHCFNDIKYLFQENLNLLIDGQYDDLELNNSISLETNLLKETFINKNKNNKDNKDNKDLFLQEKDIIIDLIVNIDSNTITTLEILNKIELNIDLNFKKTSSLFTLSITLGYILQLFDNKINYIDKEEYELIYIYLTLFGNILGYIFQISDDILDYEDDIVKNNPNICNILGQNKTLDLIKNGCNWLYINSIYIKQLMENSDIEKDCIENNNTNNKNNKDNKNDKNKDYICIDNNNYTTYKTNTIYKTNTQTKKISFDIKAIHEIIEKIENRVSNIDLKL